ncbi:hypothetical protein Pcinc_003407 [Petrolisthes cinctipes]|uniref:Uncharacterized protein n=1 Tax=Petrolisthes cinctipes TaxID=88211 RepID=A0AAE1GJJ1_PETCI|nr:hypothetical protein Pcinc_003407 [Petrolisthes cinctipes]
MMCLCGPSWKRAVSLSPQSFSKSSIIMSASTTTPMPGLTTYNSQLKYYFHQKQQQSHHPSTGMPCHSHSSNI